MKIHTIGDSHAMYPWQNIKDIKMNVYIGKLCYSVGRDGLNIDKFGIKDDDLIIFCFGEVDARWQIGNHVKDDDDYRIMINDIVDKYFLAVKNATSKYKNLTICIYNVLPAVRKELYIHHPGYPTYGDCSRTDEERKSYALYFNEKFKEKCNEYNFIFFDIYHYLLDKDGLLNYEISDTAHHITKELPIVNFFKNKFNILLETGKKISSNNVIFH